MESFWYFRLVYRKFWRILFREIDVYISCIWILWYVYFCLHVGLFLYSMWGVDADVFVYTCCAARTGVDLMYMCAVVCVRAYDVKCVAVFVDFVCSMHVSTKMQIAKTLVSTSIRHRSDTKVSDRCLIYVDMSTFAIWDGIQDSVYIVWDCWLMLSLYYQPLYAE